jgi:hypothetical protein
MVTPGAGGVVNENSGSVPVPKKACITVPAAPATMQWAQGYSGCTGAGPSESHVDSRSVCGLPSMKTSDSLRRIGSQDLLLKTDKNSETSAMRFKPALTAWEYSH